MRADRQHVLVVMDACLYGKGLRIDSRQCLGGFYPDEKLNKAGEFAVETSI